MNAPDNVLSAAIAAADAGLAVIWQKGKRAVASGWNKGPAATAEHLRDTYRDGHNVAFRAGPTSCISGDAVVVLDVDLRSEDEADRAAARAAYAELVGDRLKPTVKTGGGGAHLYLRMPADTLPTAPSTILRQSDKRTPSDDPSKPGKPAWTIELLAAEHAVTMPPSIHPSGQRYQWVNGGLEHVEAAPDSLLRALAVATSRDGSQGGTAGSKPDDEADELPPIPAPAITEAMYHGMVGEVMRAASDGTEVNPAAAGMAFIAFASAALGRERYVSIGDTRHHARIYSVHVGRSSHAGKGMALALSKRVRREIGHIAPERTGHVCGHFHDGGLSSREGLAWKIRDPSDTVDKEGFPTDPGEPDKRLFVVEEELANVLEQARRDGNTLSAALRTTWDGGDIAPATKTNRTRASNPHIAIHACITPSELAMAMDSNSLTNGFANRFLFVLGERIGIVPFPPPTPDSVVHSVATRLHVAISEARSPGEVPASTAARDAFAAFYRRMRIGRGIAPVMRGLMERHPPYAWRLALTFALLDCSPIIEHAHMAAALAWLDYCRKSTVSIFSTARAEADAGKADDLAAKIIELLQANGGAMDREPLRLALGKPDKTLFDSAIEALVTAGAIETTTTPRAGGGRGLRTYRLKDPRRFERLARFGTAPSDEASGGLPRFAAVCSDDGEAPTKPPQTATNRGTGQSETGQLTAETAQTAEGACAERIADDVVRYDL